MSEWYDAIPGEKPSGSTATLPPPANNWYDAIPGELPATPVAQPQGNAKPSPQPQGSDLVTGHIHGSDLNLDATRAEMSRQEEIDRIAVEEADNFHKHNDGEYGKRPDTDYERYATAVMSRLGANPTPEAVKSLRPILDAFDLTKDSDLATKTPEELRPLVLYAAAYEIEKRDKEQPLGFAGRTGVEALGGINKIGGTIARLNPLRTADQNEFERQIEDVAFGRHRTSPEGQGMLSRVTQGVIAFLPKMGVAAMAGGVGGTGLAFGAPAGEETYANIRRRGGGVVSATTAGLATGIGEAFLMHYPLAKVMGATPSYAGKSLQEIAKRVAINSAIDGVPMTAASILPPIAEEIGTRTGGGQARPIGELTTEMASSIPEVILQALLLQGVKAAKDTVMSLGETPSRKDFKQTFGLKGLSGAERARFVKDHQEILASQEQALQKAQESPQVQQGQNPAKQLPAQPDASQGPSRKRGGVSEEDLPMEEERSLRQEIVRKEFESGVSNPLPLTRERVFQYKKDKINAQQVQEASPPNGGSSAQREFRQEDVSPPEGGQGVQPGGRGDGNLEGQAAPEAPQEEAQGQPADSSAAAGVETTPIPAEAPPTPETGATYGIRNAKMAETTGVPEPETLGRLSHPELMAAAMKAPASDIDATITKLRENPTLAATPWENAQVLRKVTEVGNELQADIRSEKPDEAKQKVLEDQLVDLQGISKRTGTAQGQALESRKMEANEDFSLAARVTRLREAKEKPLSPEERATVAESTAEIERLTTELEKAQSKNAELEKAHGEVVAEVAASSSRSPEDNIRDFAKRNGLNYDMLLSAAGDVHQGMKDQVASRRAAKAEAHKQTGISGLDRYNIENRGRDFSTVSDFDVKAGRIVEEFPEVFDEEARKDPSRAVWDLLAEKPIKDLRLDDPRVLKEAAAMSSGGFELSPEPKPEGKKPAVSVRRAAAKQKVVDAWANFRKAALSPVVSANPLRPDMLKAAYDLAKAHIDLGITTFTEFMQNVRKQLGDKDGEEKRSLFAAAWKRLKDLGELPERDIDAMDPASVRRLAQQLHREVVELGTTDREEAVKAVHEELGHYVPEITRRQTEDAISGYGDFKELSKDEISRRVREHKGELQQLAKLEDMRKGQAPSKTGVERREPSDEERRLIQQVNEAKKRGGFTVTDPAHQLKLAQQSAERALTNWLKDRYREIETREKIVKERKPLDATERLTALKEERSRVQGIYDDAFPREKKSLTPEQRIAATGRALDRTIEQLAGDLKEGKIGRKPLATKASTPEIEAKRAKLDALRAQREELRAHDPAYRADQEQRSNATYKRDLTKRLADYQDRVARGDYAAKNPPKRVLTKDQNTLKFQIEQQKLKLRIMEATARNQNRSRIEKAADLGSKVVRFNVLSYPSIFGKLTAMAASRILEMPIRELSGGLSSWRHPEIAEKSPIHGGMDFRAVLDGYIGLATGIGSGLKMLRHNQESPLTVQMGKGRVEAASVLDYPGRVHAAFKEPIKQMAFNYAKAKYLRWAGNHNIDVTDPMVMTRIDSECYQHAERQIFMNDNAAAKRFQEFITARVDPKTGHATIKGKLGEATGKTLVPVVTVPTNIVAEVFEHVTGLAEGNVRARNAIRAGLSDLEPAEADMIMRKLKNGNVGAAIGLVAVLTGGAGIGAFHQHGKKYRDDELKPGEVEVGDSRYKIHTIPTEVYQFFATIGQVATTAFSKKNPEQKGITRGTIAAMLGLVEDVPFVREMFDLSKLQQNPDDFFGELAKSRIVPGMVQQIANMQDRDSSGNTIKRKPESFWQHLETGIPGLRQNVPEKKAKKWY
jgi:DNA-binding transcriptional ArsR family regulator